MFKKFFKSFKYGQKGFTLIELLVVVAILGVLAAVAIPNVGKFIGKGKVEAANSEFTTVQNGVAAAQADEVAIASTLDKVALAAVIQPYIQNALKYEYTLTNNSGVIVITGDDSIGSKAQLAGLTWDTTNLRWK
jgi:type IV pilus assembly protein PilA